MFFTEAELFYMPTNSAKEFQFLHTHINTYYVLDSNLPNECKVILYNGFCTLLIISGVEYLLINFSAIYVFFGQILFKSPLAICLFFCCFVLDILSILWILIIYQMYDLQTYDFHIFSLIV